MATWLVACGNKFLQKGGCFVIDYSPLWLTMKDRKILFKGPSTGELSFNIKKKQKNISSELLASFGRQLTREDILEINEEGKTFN